MDRITQELKELKHSEQTFFKDKIDRIEPEEKIVKRKLWNNMFQIKYFYNRTDYNSLIENRVKLKKQLKNIIKLRMKKAKKERMKKLNNVDNFDIFNFDKILKHKNMNWNGVNFGNSNLSIKEQVLNHFKEKFQKVSYCNVKVNKKSELFYKKLASLTNDIMNNRVQMPELWKKSWIKLIPKKVIPSSPGDLRPISILPVIYRIITKAITNKIYAASHKKINWRIRGFLNSRSTTDIVMLLKSLIINNFKASKKTFIGFLDIKGAYDNVSYAAVKIALKEFGFSKNQGKAIVNILKNHKFGVEIQGELTKCVRRTIGLPQGDPMAPILFNFVALAITKRFIIENNLKEGFTNNTNDIAVLSYADDFTLISDNYKKLKEYFTSIKIIFNNFGLELDPNKSGFTTNSTSRKKSMEIENNWIINRRSNVEILGYFVFENKYKRSKQQEIVNRIRLIASFLPLKFIQPYRLNLVINSKILSKISYLCRGERFEPCMLRKIDTIVRSIIKTKTGLDKKLSSEIFYKDLSEGGFGLTQAEDIAKNCYMGSFFNYFNHKSKPIRCCFEEAYFNSIKSKDKNFFTEICNITRPFHIRQGKCDTREKYSKIGKFNFFNIYTDGSCFKGWSGGGIHIRGHRNGKIRLFNRRLSFGKGTNNKGEILAILQTVKELPRESNANIFVDSNVALGALSNRNYRGKYEIISRTFKKIIRHKKINIQLIKVESHCGNKGNEKADELAKEGTASSNYKDIEEYISNTYSFLIPNKKRTDEEDYNPEPIFNLYTWAKQYKKQPNCNITSLWMRSNRDSPMNKYRFIGYRNNGLIEYKYGQKVMNCHIYWQGRDYEEIKGKGKQQI
ncbi:hypothetical protein ABK040_011347 [Willaertia magna]